jgi:hypothetical protein
MQIQFDMNSYDCRNVSTSLRQQIFEIKVLRLYCRGPARPAPEPPGFFLAGLGCSKRCWSLSCFGSMKRKLARRSIRHELARRSIRHELARRSIRHELARRSIRHELARRSIRHELAPRSIRHELARRSIRHEVPKQPLPGVTTPGLNAPNISKARKGRHNQSNTYFKSNSTSCLP